jgi:hypothetical protein
VELRKDENVARYLYERSKYRPGNKTVKHSAFMPPPDMLLSVFRTYGLMEDGVWALSDALGERAAVARADVVVLSIEKAGVLVDPDDEPKRHANISGWPSDLDSIVQIAIQLALNSHLTIR